MQNLLFATTATFPPYWQRINLLYGQEK